MHKASVHTSDHWAQDAVCFMKWLTTELAPTLLGNKPATVLSLMNSTYQATLTMWRNHGRDALTHSRLRFLTLRTGPNLETVLFYRPDTLQRCITDKDHQDLLKELGYPVEAGLEHCLDLLRERFRYSCPHEVGILLGIPLKDVLGFMDKADLQLTCRKEWCVYGNPAASLAVMETFAADRSKVSWLIEQGADPYELMNGDHEELREIA